MKNFVTAEWLMENLDKGEVIIFDVRYELGNEEYGLQEFKKGHVEKAVFVPMEDVLTGEVRQHGGRHPLPQMDEFVRVMNDLGVDDKKTVVVYDDGELAMAGRLWWMLRYSGKEDVYILKGGIKEWKDKKFPLSTKEYKYPSGEKLTFKEKRHMIANIEDVLSAINEDRAVIVDSRTPDRYLGEIEPIDRIPGHIPTAINFPWTELVENLDERDSKKLKDHYKKLEDVDKIIVHCGSGITGTVNIMFMEEAGLKPVLYLGGYSDWISYEENEVVNESK